MAIYWHLFLMASIWLMAFLRFPLWLWSAVIVAAVSLPTALGFYSDGLLLLHWALIVLILLPLNIPALRRVLISNKLLPVLRKALTAR